MANTPRRTTRRGSTPDAPAGPSARDRIIEALMVLLAERPFSRIGLPDVAEAADLPLAALRAQFDGKLGILAAFMRRIDLAVLAGDPPDLSSGPRDRLFEVEMRRLDALAPYKEALRSLARSARRDPGLACALHRLAARSQKWMLVAAGVRHGGLLGCVAVEGAVMIHLEAMRAWLDDDADLGRTMAALDRALRRGERAIRLLDDVCSLLPRALERGRRMREAGREARSEEG